MKPRLTLAAAVTAAVVALVPVACGDEPSSFGPAHVESNVAHVRATAEEAVGGSGIVRTVGAQLYAPIAKEAGDGNLAFSPLSIATALGMTRAGARGDSAEQLDAFFGVGPDDDLHRLLNGADETVRSLSGPVTVTDRDALVDLEIDTANALWGQSGVTFEQPFLDELRASYDTSMWTADYRRDPGGARAAINDWVKGRTGEKIADLLPDGSVDEDTRLVLVNALRFSAPWPQRLTDLPAADFTTASGATVQAPRLKADAVTHRDGDDWQAVTLDYAGGKLGFTLLVPDEGKLAAVEDALDADLLQEATAPDEEHDTSVTFPSFDLDARAPLRATLQGLGVDAPFTTAKDFQPMTRDPRAQPLALDDVEHRATVTVDERGTEAAAATGATFTNVGGFIGGRELLVDRPFLFVIHDLETGTPLFIGRVADPTAS